MRWSLRYQFLAPTLTVMLLAFTAVGIAQTVFAMRQVERAIQTRLQEVAATLNETTFPLSDAVLMQMSGLTGAEYAVADTQGALLARSSEAISLVATPARVHQPDDIELSAANREHDPQYFASVVDLQRRSSGREAVRLHIYYPVAAWRQARQQAATPTLLIGAGALICQMVLAVVIAQRVVSPIQSLTHQVEKIADGDYQPLTPPGRNDEIHDLASAVNQMSTRLGDYANTIRRSERLRTLGQLGGGIAHHLRNAATGCRLALDFHRAECTSGDEENVRVAVEQLEVMERHLKRFLTWGNSIGDAPDGQPSPAQAAPSLLNPGGEVKRIIELTRPSAKHLHVAFEAEITSAPIVCRCDADGFSQTVTNLLVNAIEAAAEGVAFNKPAVITRVSLVDGNACVEIIDSGSGPPENVDIYEPFVSQKIAGTGLGLAVARSFAEQAGGTLTHHRHDGKTTFSLVLPTTATEPVSEIK